VNLPESYDKLRELPIIVDMPYKIEEGEHGQQGLPYKVERLNSGVNLTKIKDAHAENTETDLYGILSRIFLIDGRIYKHYRLLSWFP
jgi:hypothetical protein